MSIRIPNDVARSLINQGLVPANCHNVELLMPADGAMVLRYEVFVMQEDLPKLSLAFAAMAAPEQPVGVRDWRPEKDAQFR